nr:hypothetical protein [Methylobacterium sp. GXS13]
MAQDINYIASETRALAAHSDTSINTDAITQCAVLSITHSGLDQAFFNHLNGWSSGTDIRYLDNWRYGRRQLVVIDEAFPLVRSFSLTQHDIGVLHNVLRNSIHPGLREIEELTAKLLATMKMVQTAEAQKDSFLSKELMLRLSELVYRDISSCFRAVRPDDLQSFCRKDTDPRKELESCRAVINELSQIKRIGNAFTTKSGNVVTISASEPAIPDDIGGVILDATASKDKRYELLPARMSIIRPSRKLRTYNKVTLWVSKGHQVGKHYLTKNAANDWPGIANSVSMLRGDDKDVLVCCHKDAEDAIREAVTNLGSCHTAHYGNITGKNDWYKGSTVVIFGLPYLNPIVPTQICAALLPRSANAETHRLDDNFLDRASVSSKLIASYNVIEVIQAINRVRCRQMVDANGGCEPTDVFILCQKGEAGEDLIAQLIDEMPGVVVREWELKASSRKTKTTPSANKVLKALSSLAPGEHLSSEVRKMADVSSTSYSRFVQELSRPNSEMAKTVRGYGVTYISECGRSAQCRFSVAA